MKDIREILDIVTRRMTKGLECSPETLWQLFRDDGDPELVTDAFRDSLEDPKYKKLVELHMRKLAIHNIEHVPFIRSIVEEAALLANVSILEELIIAPEDIPFEQRRLLAKDLNSMLAKPISKPKPEEKEEPEETQSAYDIAAQEDADLQALLARYPKTMHESIMKRWKLERMKVISSQEHKVRSAI